MAKGSSAARATRTTWTATAFPAEADLDDLDELIGRQLPEIPCDGIDQDGDLADVCEIDVDGDGAAGDWDCDDLDPEIGPGPGRSAATAPLARDQRRSR